MDKYVSFACDHAGVDLREPIFEFLKSLGYEVVDHGTFGTDSVDYPDFARLVCADVLGGAIGLLICGTGIGMSISANKYKGVRAALCTNEFMAQATRAHNNANVLCLGARVTSSDEALKIIEVFLSTEFEGGRHQTRVQKIEQ